MNDGKINKRVLSQNGERPSFVLGTRGYIHTHTTQLGFSTCAQDNCRDAGAGATPPHRRFLDLSVSRSPRWFSWLSRNLLALEREFEYRCSHTKLYFPSQTSRKQFFGGFTKFGFTVDEGKGRLNSSRDKNEGKHRRRKVEKSCVTPAGASASLTSRINGTTYTHTHTCPGGLVGNLHKC